MEELALLEVVRGVVVLEKSAPSTRSRMPCDRNGEG